MTHTPFRIAAGALSLLFLAGVSGCSGNRTPEAPEHYDLWIRNGTVVDGTDGAPYAADVLVRGDTIAFIGSLNGKQVAATRTIDARGKFVAPGFIDTHAHGDPTRTPLTNFITQGVTTVVLGQDGVTAAFAEHEAPSLDDWRAARADEAGTTTLAQWMRRVDEHGSEVNIAALSGHGTLREIAGVDNSPAPTPAQMTVMQEILRADLASGAFGMSFGLEYNPGRYSQTSEQQALGEIVGRAGGVVMSHMRTEDTGKIAAAIDELLAMDARVHASHIKIVSGQSVEEARLVLQQLERARASGKAATADVYPYTASAANLVFLYPDWAKQRADYEAAVRNRRAELEAHIRSRVQERLGPHAILFTSGPHANKRLSDLVAELGKPFEKIIIDDLGYGGPQSAHFVMTPAVQDEFVHAPNVGVCTDGGPMLLHPRSAGAFARVLQDHVGDPPRMRLEQAIHKMTGFSAGVVGLLDRGTLAPGKKADIVVLTPESVRDNATWSDPLLPAEGFDVVIINGAIALENGEPQGRHGKMLRAAPSR